MKLRYLAVLLGMGLTAGVAPLGAYAQAPTTEPDMVAPEVEIEPEAPAPEPEVAEPG
ncbi:MAG: hypothetical protein WBA86_09610 [Nodosilinea sp.]